MNETAEVLESASRGGSNVLRYFGGPMAIILSFLPLPLLLSAGDMTIVQRVGLLVFCGFTFITGLGLVAPVRLKFVSRLAAACWALVLALFPVWVGYSMAIGENDFGVDGVSTLLGSLAFLWFVGRPLLGFAMTGTWPGRRDTMSPS